jgi:hypothetical protein
VSDIVRKKGIQMLARLDSYVGLSRFVGIAPNIPVCILLRGTVQLPILVLLLYQYWIMLFNTTTLSSAIVRGLLYVIGIEAADLFSGFLHIYFDNERTTRSWCYPIRQAAHGFRTHHDKPHLIADENLLWAVSDTSVLLLLYMPILYILHQYQQWDGMAYMLGFLTCGMLIQASHANCHRTNSTQSRLLTRLPTISRQQHKLHHTPPHTCNFAIGTGHTNGLLNALGRHLSPDNMYTWVGRAGFYLFPVQHYLAVLFYLGHAQHA